MDPFLGLLVQSCCGEGGTLRTNNTGTCSQCLGHTGFAPPHGMCAFPVYTAWALGCSAGNCLRPALGFVHFPGLSCSGSGTQVLLKGADLVGPFCALLCPSQVKAAQVTRYLASAVVVTYRLPCPCCSFFCVYNRRTFSGGC